MTLALVMGRLDVDAMLEEMSAEQYEEWLEFYRLVSFGPQVEDLRAGMVLAALHEPYRNTDKRREPFGPADFCQGMINRIRRSNRTNPKLMLAKMTALLGPPKNVTTSS